LNEDDKEQLLKDYDRQCNTGDLVTAPTSVCCEHCCCKFDTTDQWEKRMVWNY